MYQFILLADSVGKVFARAIKSAGIHALPAKLRNDTAMLCGGIPGLETELVVAVTMLQERCKDRGESIGVFFVDATQAFYVVFCSLVADVTESGEAVAYLLSQLKLPPVAFDELRTIRKAVAWTSHPLTKPLSRTYLQFSQHVILL